MLEHSSGSPVALGMYLRRVDACSIAPNPQKDTSHHGGILIVTNDTRMQYHVDMCVIYSPGMPTLQRMCMMLASGRTDSQTVCGLSGSHAMGSTLRVSATCLRACSACYSLTAISGAAIGYEPCYGLRTTCFVPFFCERCKRCRLVWHHHCRFRCKI